MNSTKQRLRGPLECTSWSKFICKYLYSILPVKSKHPFEDMNTGITSVPSHGGHIFKSLRDSQDIKIMFGINFLGFKKATSCIFNGKLKCMSESSSQPNKLLIRDDVFQCYQFSKQFLSNLSKIKYLAFFITFCFVVSLAKMVTLTNNIVYKKFAQYRKCIWSLTSYNHSGFDDCLMIACEYFMMI